MSLTVFWYRRDLRLDDNAGLTQALREKTPVQPIFIFDSEILSRLQNSKDPRVSFIYDTVVNMKKEFQKLGSDLWIYHGKPKEVFQKILSQHEIKSVYCNHDYEPQALKRDQEIQKLCQAKGVSFHSFKDQVIFEKSEILTSSERPYTVFGPYKRKWLSALKLENLKAHPTQDHFANLKKHSKISKAPSLQEIGFEKTDFRYYPKLNLDKELIEAYAENRDFPALDATSHLGLHLRFGTLSIRKAVCFGQEHSPVWLSELIWREFFMQILFHFPHVEKSSFRPEYDQIEWRKSPKDLEKWQTAQTGYPIVDAGIRQMLETGYMHNRVRMIVGSFLCKHLLIHWLHGEKFFAKHLLDYEMASNNGNWQWVAGSGCDAAPYFRVFNPKIQTQKFDPDLEYIRKWVPEFESKKYPQPIISHEMGRERALRAYFKALKGKKK